MPPRARKLLAAWREARAAAGETAPPRWNVVYDALEQDTDEVYAEMESAIADLWVKAEQKEAWARKEAEEERWESQAVEVDIGLSAAAMDRRYRGEEVWLYHGTSSKLLPKILREGLTVPRRRVERGAAPGVFLTADPGYQGGKGDALFYARRAVAKFGGEPVVLRIVMPYDDLEPDPDDVDLSSGRYQFVYYGTIPPERILEVDGQRTR